MKETIISQIQDLLKKINMYTRHTMMKQFEKEDLTFHQFYILKTISKNPHINYTQLGKKLNLAKSSISLLINKLVDEGYINRVEEPDDRRNKFLILTELGNEELKKCKIMSRNTFGSLIHSIDKNKLTLIRNDLQLLFNAMEENIEHHDIDGGNSNE